MRKSIIFSDNYIADCCYCAYEISYENQKITVFAKNMDHDHCFDSNDDLLYADIIKADYKDYCQVGGSCIADAILMMDTSDFIADEGGETEESDDSFGERLWEEKMKMIKAWFIEECWKKSHAVNCRIPSFYQTHDSEEREKLLVD